MKAARRFMVHNSDINRTRHFEEGEEVPEEWAKFVGAESLLIGSDVDPASLLDISKPMEDVLTWVMDVDGPDRRERVREAYAAEQGGKQRKTLLETLEEMETGLLGLEVDHDLDEEADEE